MLGFVSGMFAGAAVCVSSDNDAAKERLWKHKGKVYHLVEVEPLSSTEGQK